MVRGGHAMIRNFLFSSNACLVIEKDTCLVTWVAFVYCDRWDKNNWESERKNRKKISIKLCSITKYMIKWLFFHVIRLHGEEK